MKYWKIVNAVLATVVSHSIESVSFKWEVIVGGWNIPFSLKWNALNWIGHKSKTNRILHDALTIIMEARCEFGAYVDTVFVAVDKDG